MGRLHDWVRLGGLVRAPPCSFIRYVMQSMPKGHRGKHHRQGCSSRRGATGSAREPLRVGRSKSAKTGMSS